MAFKQQKHPCPQPHRLQEAFEKGVPCDWLKYEQQASGSPLQLQQLCEALQRPSSKPCLGARTSDSAAAVLSEEFYKTYQDKWEECVLIIQFPRQLGSNEM